MAFFNSKKTAAETPIPEVMEEHKQSIGNQVMEALGVGEPAAADKAKEDEEFEIMMPMKSSSSWQSKRWQDSMKTSVLSQRIPLLREASRCKGRLWLQVR